jgi:uncharacterized protein (UPF0332 family)
MVTGENMNAAIEKKRVFRLEQSREKLRLASLMMQKGLFNDSVIYCYLSMFYSVRVLLIDKDADSDNQEKILELMERYYEPAGWTSVNIAEVLKEAKYCKDKIEKAPGCEVKREEAEKFRAHAETILDEVLKKTANFSPIST